MKVSRAGLIYLAIWVGVVVVSSTVGWALISRAGETAVDTDEPPGRTPTTSAPRSPGPTISPGPASPSSPTSPSDVSLPVQRTWSGLGGVVVVECRGTAAGLVSAQPDNGFSIEVDETGPRRVEVEFEGEGEDNAKTKVRVECVGGEPSFEVDSDSD